MSAIAQLDRLAADPESSPAEVGRHAQQSPGPADSAAPQTLVTRPHEAVDHIKQPGWGQTALQVLSSRTPT